MRGFVSAALLSLPIAALAGNAHEGSLRRRHIEHARTTAIGRRATQYKLVDDYNKDTFFDMFDFFTAPDPTHGLVNFVDQKTADKENLAYVQDDGTIVLAVDDKAKLQLNQPRNSVRIQSKKAYNAGTLFIADIYAMPHGCSTWPAYWMVGDNWPNNGELDILEGVNEQSDNQITAHTGAVCNIVKDTVQTAGRLVGQTCQSKDGANAGCNFAMDSNATYGHGFNMNAGGVYAHTWETDAIKVYFFPRQAIPQDIKDGNPDPESWGQPYASFPSSNECSIGDAFQDNKIVFDITLCGDWAGAAYGQSGCPGTCAQTVTDPKNFRVAKFKIKSLKVFGH
ncbi:glycoside hydrolase family 16 protein [Cristinia sonorae]|uniref:Glycoside hydrolase family 16 protein n=1 Tax=Cristinia sonorae TaxID=1940300 RepID=A0A8K0UH23_9AGAR|nr:glycoside hydrolase family 16 protein [Cristinia sonorae]